MSDLLTTEQRRSAIDVLATRMTESVDVSYLEACYYTAQYELLEGLEDWDILEQMDNYNLDPEDL